MKDYKTPISLYYLEVPLLARYQEKGLFVEAGPTVSYLLSSKIDTDEMEKMFEGFPQGEEGEEPTVEIYDKADFRKVDLGYAIGAGYQFQNGVELGLRYNGSFTEVDKDGESNLRNSIFQLSVGYRFSGR